MRSLASPMMDGCHICLLAWKAAWGTW